MGTNLHIPVLYNEVLEKLNIKNDGIYVDGTIGRGGHASGILKLIPKGYLYGFDRDIEAINYTNEFLQSYGTNFTLFHSLFSHMKKRLEEVKVTKVDGILLDIGVSSCQFDDPTRGFSYRFDSRLDMRMDATSSLSAYDIVNNYDLTKLTNLIRNYGEEKEAYAIAKRIIKEREIKPVETTFELVDIIKVSLPKSYLRNQLHPEKKTFQALRYEVNQELEELRLAIIEALSLLKVGGRLAIISFNSLEDRIVKKAFKEASSLPDTGTILPPLGVKVLYKLVEPKMIEATPEELEQNSRSHSAKLRIIERIGE